MIQASELMRVSFVLHDGFLIPRVCFLATSQEHRNRSPQAQPCLPPNIVFDERQKDCIDTYPPTFVRKECKTGMHGLQEAQKKLTSRTPRTLRISRRTSQDSEFPRRKPSPAPCALISRFWIPILTPDSRLLTSQIPARRTTLRIRDKPIWRAGISRGAAPWLVLIIQSDINSAACWDVAGYLSSVKHTQEYGSGSWFPPV